jgi:hypothetical protein
MTPTCAGCVSFVLLCVDNPPESGHDLLGIAHHALATPVAADTGVASSAIVSSTAVIDELMVEWGWSIDGCDWAGKAAVAEAIDGVRSGGFDLPDGMLDTYAAAMHTVAAAEIAGVPTESDEAAVRYVVLGTVLVEPLLLALRRLAQQSASHERFGARPLR